MAGNWEQGLFIMVVAMDSFRAKPWHSDWQIKKQQSLHNGGNKHYANICYERDHEAARR